MKRQALAAVLMALLLICALASCSTPGVLPHESVREHPISPVPVVCEAQGELIEGLAEAGRYLAPAQSAEDYIYQCLLAEQSEIDISAYKITTEQITSLYTAVMNTHPDLFFVNSGISYSYDSSGVIHTLKPSYRLTGEALEKAREACESALLKICAGVDPAWSDFEIALYLHDYLCLHFAYDEDYEIYDMHQFLTLGKGVCQAYTLTYMELLSRFGIASDVAVSQGMNHIWNIVELGGVPYHVDVTWDDPVPNTEGLALHANFLRSDLGIRETEHYGWESRLSCTSDAYESTFVKEVEQPFCHTAGKWFYADGAERCIYAVDFSTMSRTAVLEISDKWMSADGKRYYVDAFVGVGTYRGNLIYNTPKQIFAYNLQSGVVSEVQIPSLQGKQIFGLWVTDDTVHYTVSDTPDGQMQMLRCSISGLVDYLWGDADQNGVVDGRDITAICRYLEGLPTVCHTGAADLDDSGEVDARDAEILRRYIVENN